MALTTRSAPRMGAQALVNLIRNNPQAAYSFASGAGKMLAEMVRRPLPVPTGPTYGPQNPSILVRAGGGPTGRKKKRKGNRVQRQQGVPRGIPSVDRIRGTFKFIVPVSCSAGGVASFWFWPGYKNTNYNASFTSVSSQFSNLCSSYAYFEAKKITVVWDPYVPYTIAGQAALGIQEDPTTTVVTLTAQTVIQKAYSATSDIKESCALVWRPSNEQEREAKVLQDASALTADPRLRVYAPCSIIFFSQSTSGATTIGNLHIEFDCVLSGLY